MSDERAHLAAALDVAAVAWVEGYQPGPQAEPSVTRATRAAIIAWLRTFDAQDLICPHGLADLMEKQRDG